MQGVSRHSLADAQDRLASAGPVPPDELFNVVDLLDREISLRRVLTDPATFAEQKAALVHMLLDGKVDAATADLVASVAASRWSTPRDLVDAIEILAVQSAVATAERDGYVDDLEDALFRFGRVVGGDAELRGVLADRTIPVEHKVELVRTLLDGKVGPVTLRLIEQAVAAPRGRTLDKALEEYAELAAAYRRRVVAVVRVAAPLTDGQHTRLRAALTRIYGRGVNLNVVVEPDIVGGISVQVGGEVIDATIVTRLDEARRRLVG